MEYKRLKNKKSRLLTGFTLIEMLIVVVIMIILASIVLVSIGNVKNKAKDTAIKADMVFLGPAAKIYYDNNGTYGGVCDSDDFQKIRTAVQKITGYSCCFDDSPGKWSFCTNLNATTTAWCVDSISNRVEISYSECSNMCAHGIPDCIIGD